MSRLASHVNSVRSTLRSRPKAFWDVRSFASSPTQSFSSRDSPAATGRHSPQLLKTPVSELEVSSAPLPLAKASDIVFRGALHEDAEGGGARHAPAVSKMWSNIPAHVRESFRAPSNLEDAPKPSAPLLLDNVLSKVKTLIASTGLGPAKWSQVARPYYQGRIALAPYQKGQTAAYNYPPVLVPRELAHRFPLDMYVDPVFQTSDAAQRIRMRGFTLFPRLQSKTTLLLVFSGQPLSGLWTGLRQWLDAVATDFQLLPNTQVLKLHCEEGWFNRRTHQLTKFQLRRQVNEDEIWTTFVYRGKWKWEYERTLHLYNKELPVVLLLDSLGYVRWHAVGLPTSEATQLFTALSRKLAHEKKAFT